MRRALVLATTLAAPAAAQDLSEALARYLPQATRAERVTCLPERWSVLRLTAHPAGSLAQVLERAGEAPLGERRGTAVFTGGDVLRMTLRRSWWLSFVFRVDGLAGTAPMLSAIRLPETNPRLPEARMARRLTGEEAVTLRRRLAAMPRLEGRDHACMNVQMDGWAWLAETVDAKGYRVEAALSRSREDIDDLGMLLHRMSGLPTS